MLEGDYKFHSDISLHKPLVWKSDAITSVCPISNEAVIKPQRSNLDLFCYGEAILKFYKSTFA